MIGDDAAQVFGTTVSYLNSFSIEDAAEFIVFWEVFIQDFEKLLANIGFQGSVEWWGIPDNLSVAISLFLLCGSFALDKIT